MSKVHNHPPKDHSNKTHREKHHKEESLAEFIEEEENKAIKFLKKAALIMCAIFLILMMITLSLPIDTLSSLLASITLQENPPDFIAKIGGATIVIQGDTYDRLLDEYKKEQKTEFKACLMGTKKNHTYTATDIYIPVMHSKSYSHVQAELCTEGTIIDLHTHPYLSCIFSDVDIKSLKTVKQINPDAIIGLMCGTQRFNFYGY